jgi:hypothetical protein
MWKEIAFRQIIGLLPRDLSDLTKLGEARYVMKHVTELLEHLDAPQWAFDYLLAVFRGQPASLPSAA